MVKHVLCFKLKDGSLESCKKAQEILLSMKGNVPSVKDVVVGLDFLHSNRSYDFVLEVTLDSKEALDEYQQDEYHVNVVKKYIHDVTEKSIAVDYEF